VSTEVKVELGPRSYEIHIGPGLLGRIDELCRPVINGKNGLLVTDATIAPLYADSCARTLARLGVQVGRAVVPPGETSKSGQWLFHIYEKAVEQGLDRRSFMVALGGGVVGDLAGFAAASYLRGIPYVQVPTTLLSMVDSAVGGKTGINLPQGKNLVGAFYQPALVVADLDALRSLPHREFVSGLAEVIKYGVIRDPELFQLLEKQADRLLAGEVEVLERVVARSCQIKADVVGRDEREETGLSAREGETSPPGGGRAILNFGHTIGHAIETVTGYGHYLHGEAIAIGMAFAARLSVALRGMDQRDCDRLITLLARIGLPTDVPDCPWQLIRVAIGVDKKSKGGKPRFVLADRIGSVTEGCEVSEAVLHNTWHTPYVAKSHGF
jgi:3-dehydroquinate synthase